jgi:hypothetical protein
MIWQLLRVSSDWQIVMIRPGGLLLVISLRPICSPSFSIMGGGVGKKVKLNLDVKIFIIFARSHSQHCWRCSSYKGRLTEVRPLMDGWMDVHCAAEACLLPCTVIYPSVNQQPHSFILCLKMRTSTSLGFLLPNTYTLTTV